MNEIKFNVGDKVISFTGLQGKIEKVFNGKDYILAYIKYEDGKEDYITECDKTHNFDSFYLIGKNVYGRRLERKTGTKERPRGGNRRTANGTSVRTHKYRDRNVARQWEKRSPQIGNRNLSYR